MTRVLKALVLALAGAVLLSGCEFSVYKMPLPGGADVGSDPITVEATFTDVLDLVPQSTVKVADVTVGKVTDVSLTSDYAAEVTMLLRNDVDLPDNAIADIRQTSLLGEKFVSLSEPTNPSPGRLGDDDVIPLDRTGRNPEVEEVLGALSLVLNGGGVAQLKTIARELNTTLEGREPAAKSVLDQFNLLMSQIDDNKAEIVTAITAVNKLSVSVNKQRASIDSALDNLPSALKSLDRQRADLVRMLEALDNLSDVGVRVIRTSKQATIDSLRNLQPILAQLTAAGDALPNSLNAALTYPFVDEVVGRDPTVARNLHMGDYTNLSIQLDVSLDTQLPGLPGGPALPSDQCTQLDQLPDQLPTDLSGLCEGATRAINKCLTSPSVTNCQNMPAQVIQQVCRSTPLRPLCPNGGSTTTSGPGLPLPSITLPPLLPRNASERHRAAVGPAPTGNGATVAQLTQAYDPSLVALLVPGLVTQ